MSKMGMILRFCFKLAVTFCLVIHTVPAVDLSTACQFSDDANVKFTTHLSESASDKNFGKYTSGLSIMDSGATMQGWQPVWCYDPAALRIRDDYTDNLPEGQTDHKSGYFNYVVTSVNSQTTNLALVNQSDPTQKLPFTICMGNGSNVLLKSCVNLINQHASIPLGTSTQISEFNSTVLPAKYGKLNPRTGRFYNWRVASELKIPANTNVSPGIYSGELVLTLNVKLYGQTFAGKVKVDGESTHISNYQVFIQKNCQLLKAAGDTQTVNNIVLTPITFAPASLVKNLQPASTTFYARCTKNTPYSIKLKGSHDTSGDHDSHYLINNKNGRDKIPYKLYKSDQSTVWSYDNAQQEIGTGEAQPIEVVAKVDPNSQEVPAGQYSDTITVQLTY